MGYAKEMIYTGKAIRADEALRIGLVNAVYPQAELMEQAMAMAAKICAMAPIAVRYAKQCINAEYDLDADAAIAYENKMFGQCFATKDQKEGMTAFLTKAKPSFKNE